MEIKKREPVNQKKGAGKLKSGACTLHVDHIREPINNMEI